MQKYKHISATGPRTCILLDGTSWHALDQITPLLCSNRDSLVNTASIRNDHFIRSSFPGTLDRARHKRCFV
jgi:hypothetical protein